MRNPVALQLYTLRRELKADRAGVLRKVAELGYGAVEAHDLSDPEGLRSDLDAVGLGVCAVHAWPVEEKATEILSSVAKLGATTVVVPSMPRERFADLEGVKWVAREVNEMASRAADRGVRLGYHNHDVEVRSVVEGRPALEVLADNLKPEVVLEVDTYWAAVGGQDVPRLLERLGERVRYLHLKDGPLLSGEPMTALGEGRMPLVDVLRALASVEWHVVELDECGTDMTEAVAKSFDWMRDHGFAQAGPAPTGGVSTGRGGAS